MCVSVCMCVCVCVFPSVCLSLSLPVCWVYMYVELLYYVLVHGVFANSYILLGVHLYWTAMLCQVYSQSDSDSDSLLTKSLQRGMYLEVWYTYKFKANKQH